MHTVNYQSTASVGVCMSCAVSDFKSTTSLSEPVNISATQTGSFESDSDAEYNNKVSVAVRNATSATHVAHLGPMIGADPIPTSWLSWGMNCVGDWITWTNFSWTTLHLDRLRRLARDSCNFAGFEDIFGPKEDFLTGVETYYSHMNPAAMNPAGKFWFNMWQTGILEGRRKIVKHIMEHPIISQPESRVNKVILIAGYFRSGTTLMHRMMAAQPKTRSLRLFEIIDFADPTAYVKRKEELSTDSRIADVQAKFDLMELLFPGFWRNVAESHLIEPGEAEEEVVLLFYLCLHVLYFGASGPEYTDWVVNPTNKQYVYKFIRMFLQMLNQGTTWPVTHWVLKSPIHMLFLDSFAEEFQPSFGVVFLHRDPVECVPSWCRLLETWTRTMFREQCFDLGMLGRINLWMCKLSWERAMQWQAKTDSSKYYNLKYTTFIKDPVGELEKVYEHFNIPFNDDAREATAQYLDDNPQGKHGRAKYTPEMYGLTNAIIEDTLSDYRHWAGFA
ncbi:sulfotransferase [Pelomyxa schiedti]|nr:sulfotransferase [Pelomyxa schiedti]